MDAPPAALYAATAGCTALLLCATPLAALAPALCHGRSKPRGWGDCFRAFSGMGWALWTAAIIAAARGLAGAPPLSSWAAALADPARELALTGAAAAATGALLFMAAAAVAGSTGPGGPSTRPAAAGVARPPPPRWGVAPRLTPSTAGAAVAALSCAWAAAGSAFVLTAPSLSGPAARGVYLAAAAACLAAGAGTTHGFGGRLRAHAVAGRRGGWAFVQPGRGGPAFVAAQAGAWALTGVAGAGLLALGRAAVASAPGGRAAALTAAALAAAQVGLSASLWAWRASSGAAPAPPAAARPAAAAGPFWWVPLLLLYAPVHSLVAAAAASFVLLPQMGVSPAAVAAAWAAGTAAAYALTERSDPAVTGAREWPAFGDWMARHAFPALERAGCPFQLVHDDGRGPAASPPPPLPPASPKTGTGHPVFALAPHGLYPAGAVLLALHPALRAAVRGARVSVLAASAVLRAPVIRDLASWAGVRCVSRHVAEATLATRPVLLLPGGQTELVHTWRLAEKSELVLVRRRLGFVRLAVGARSPLVPVLALGDAAAHVDPLPAPRLKAAAVRLFGFPIPYFPLGRFATPLPRKGPLRFIVGPPVWPVWEAGESEEAVVRATHAAFYEAVAGLVERHAARVRLVWEE